MIYISTRDKALNRKYYMILPAGNRVTYFPLSVHIKQLQGP